jgi:hypothetical protein
LIEGSQINVPFYADTPAAQRNRDKLDAIVAQLLLPASTTRIYAAAGSGFH